MCLNFCRGPVSRTLAKSLAAVAVSGLLAGCSGSIERFNQAYNNPSDADPVYTASVPKPKKIKKPAYVAPTYESAAIDDGEIIESPIKRANIPQPKKPYDYAQAYSAKPKYKRTYNAPKLTVAEEDLTADQSYDAAPVETVPAKPKRKTNLQSHAASATPQAVNGRITVEQGTTLYSIARANGVTVQELAAANNLVEPYTLFVGQTLRIPEPNATRQAVQKPKASSSAEQDVAMVETAPRRSKAGAVHTVVAGETLYSLGRTYGVSPFVIADANGMSAEQRLSIGQKLRIPGTSQALAQSGTSSSAETPAAPAAKKKAPLSLAEEEKQTAVAATDAEEAIGETKTANLKKPVVDPPPVQQATLPATQGLNLRWPVKGKVISTFGNKPNGLKNEGINIAVPEGTQIRAAESGVVAYAGNELKGYGNLILIRHTGGYVTAYAHAKSISVKRGDTVKRGDVIGLAGQTGAVSSPQLHFEVRKGATALDPLKFITSTTASN